MLAVGRLSSVARSARPFHPALSRGVPESRARFPGQHRIEEAGSKLIADLRARSGLTTEQLIYAGRAGGWLVVPSLEPR